ncbi:MAG: transporter, partial [Bacteroidota bacterium]
MKLKLLISYLPIYFLFPLFVYSQNDERSAALPDAHAPIGVMGDHLHQKGEWMLSYRYMRMQMQGNRLDSDGVSPVEIATQVENIFFGSPMQPPTLRVVPTEMPMDMHMLGAYISPNM